MSRLKSWCWPPSSAVSCKQVRISFTLTAKRGQAAPPRWIQPPFPRAHLFLRATQHFGHVLAVLLLLLLLLLLDAIELALLLLELALQIGDDLRFRDSGLLRALRLRDLLLQRVLLRLRCAPIPRGKKSSRQNRARVFPAPPRIAHPSRYAPSCS